MAPAARPEDADLVVVNTCAFIEEARQESIDTILGLEQARRPDAELVVTGCLAERYGDELAGALPEVDRVAPFGVPVTLGPTRPAPSGGPAAGSTSGSRFDLLELPRPPARAPWAYVKIAEGCDRALRVLRHPQLPGTAALTLDRVHSGRGRGAGGAGGRPGGPGPGRLRARPGPGQAPDRPPARSGRRPGAVGAAALPVPVRPGRPPGRRHLRLGGCRTSTCRSSHVSRPLLRAMRRWGGSGQQFAERIDRIRRLEPSGHLPLELHRRLSRRDRGRPRPAAGVRRAGPAGLVRLLRLLRGGGNPTAPACRARCRPRCGTSAWPSCGPSRTASPPRPATPASAIG